jgi:hypothetical protein
MQRLRVGKAMKDTTKCTRSHLHARMARAARGRLHHGRRDPNEMRRRCVPVNNRHVAYAQQPGGDAQVRGRGDRAVGAPRGGC